jgi:hypothetical protein
MTNGGFSVKADDCDFSLSTSVSSVFVLFVANDQGRTTNDDFPCSSMKPQSA